MMIKAILVLFFALFGIADATVTIRNFATDGTYTWRTAKLDVNKELIRAHDGQLIQNPIDLTQFVLIGTDYDCGRRWAWSGYPFCGFVAHTSKSLQSGEWSAPISLFDASGGTWQGRCVPLGCYRPRIIYCAACAADAKFKLWVNITSGADYVVLKSGTITGPYTETNTVSLGGAGDFDLLLRADGNAYIAFTYYQNNWDIKIQKLNSTFDNVSGAERLLVDGTGPHSDTSATYEAPTLFERSGRLFLTYSHTCGYCPGTAPIYMYTDASDPVTGSWTTGSALNSNSCGGQPLGVAKINDGADKWLFMSDLWKAEHDGQGGQTQYTPTQSHGEFGWANQARADLFMVPLTFDGSNLPQTFSCVSSFTLNLAPDPPAPVSNLTVDSTNDSFFTFCNIREGGNGSTQYYQTFTPTRTGVHTLKVGVLKGVTDSTVCQNINGGTCPEVDQDLVIQVVQDNSGAPGTVITTNTVPRANITSSLRMQSTTATLTSGTKYGYILRPAANFSQGFACYGHALNNNNVVSGGETYISINSGSTWSMELAGNRDLLFQLIGPPMTGTSVKIPGTGKIRLHGPNALRVQ